MATPDREVWFRGRLYRVVKELADGGAQLTPVDLDDCSTLDISRETYERLQDNPRRAS